MNVLVPIQDPCNVLEPGSWLWILAGCWMPRTAVAFQAFILVLPLIAIVWSRHHAHTAC